MIVPMTAGHSMLPVPHVRTDLEQIVDAATGWDRSHRASSSLRMVGKACEQLGRSRSEGGERKFANVAQLQLAAFDRDMHEYGSFPIFLNQALSMLTRVHDRKQFVDIEEGT